MSTWHVTDSLEFGSRGCYHTHGYASSAVEGHSKGKAKLNMLFSSNI